MKNALPIAFAAALFAGSASSQTTAASDTGTRQVLTELRSLRVELIEDLAERKAERIELLTSEMEQLRKQRIQLQQASQAQQEDSQAWKQEAWGAEYTPEQRAQLETEKAAVDVEAAKALSRQSQAAAEREAAIHARLNRERERHRRLTQELQLLQQPR